MPNRKILSVVVANYKNLNWTGCQIWKFSVLITKYEIVGKFENLEFTSYMTIQSLSLAEYEN